MRKFSTILLLAASAFIGGCSQATLVYPIFPAEQTAHKSFSFEDGYRAENGVGQPRDYDRAISSYKAAEKAGDVRATNNLGVMAMQGRGSSVSPSAARRSFTKAAAAGSANGHYNLGLMYDVGFGASSDPVAAAYEYRMAAEQGHALAQQRLAQMTESGQGTPASPSEARRLYEMAALGGDKGSLDRLEVLNGTGRQGLDPTAAAALFAADHCDCGLAPEKAMASRGIVELRRLASEGDAPARYDLAVRLLKGEASNQDPSEAARLFTLAAKQGYAPAQRQLAHMHLRGQAVAKSKVLAYAWLNLASRDSGSEGASARSELEGLEITMTTEDVRKAQALAVSGAMKGR